MYNGQEKKKKGERYIYITTVDQRRHMKLGDIVLTVHFSLRTFLKQMFLFSYLLMLLLSPGLIDLRRAMVIILLYCIFVYRKSEGQKQGIMT